jgi:gamma-glutamylcyclotransferase (GGCT)/AIG2-like uncharacterized protein YtfP
MEKSVTNCPIKMFVFGTLRKGDRLDYYMDGSKFAGKYYLEGQLMMSELGAAYIDFKEKNVATIGELHYINYPGLQRIDHLESRSGEFPKGYDLSIVPVWKLEKEGEYAFDDKNKEYAFFYRRRDEPIKIKSGDWLKRKQPSDEISKYMKEHLDNATPDSIINHMKKYLEI